MQQADLNKVADELFSGIIYKDHTYHVDEDCREMITMQQFQSFDDLFYSRKEREIIGLHQLFPHLILLKPSTSSIQLRATMSCG